MSDGLDDIIAAETVLSEVDGLAGRLVIRGRSLDDLAGRTRFEDAARLLFDGFFADLPADLARPLGEARVAVFEEVAALDERLLRLSPVEAMRALTARLADGDDLETALRLLAAPAVFTAAVVRAQAGAAKRGRLEFAEAVEKAALDILKAHKPDRPLDTNVEFYTALLLEALAFPPSAFTCVFAMGRVAGWVAHAREQVAGGRLIRPASVYVGSMPKKAA